MCFISKKMNIYKKIFKITQTKYSKTRKNNMKNEN